MPYTNDSSSIIIEPSTTAEYSVIWLHGLGADGHDFVPLVPELNLQNDHSIRFIFPHADVIPITINNRLPMRAWYDILGFSIHAETDRNGIRKSVSKIESLIEDEISKGIPSNKIILGGFSQGAVLALTTALGYQKELAGVVAISGYLPLVEEVLTMTNPINKNIPIFIAHGTEDNVVPFASGKMAYVHLVKAGYNVEWHTYPIQHSVSEQEIKDLSHWLQKQITSKS